MKWRNLLIWVIVLAGLGGFVYFYEFKGEAKREEAKAKSEKLFDVKEQDISALTLQRGSERTTIALQNGRWMIESPVSATADQSAMNDMVRNLSSTPRTRTLTGLQGLSEYGLQPPKIHLEAKTRAGALLLLDVGEKDFSGNDAYARIPPRGDVMLIPSYLSTSFDKSLFQLRDRKILDFEPEKVTQIDFASRSGHLTAEKSGTAWKLLQPVSARGDSIGISTFLGDVFSSEVAEFVDKPDADLKQYGLAPPEGMLTIRVGEGSPAKLSKLLLGTKTGDRIYAKLDSSPSLFEISASTAEKMRPLLFKLRDKHIVAVEVSDLQHAMIQLGAETYEFDRQTAKESLWKVILPKKLAGKEAREWKFWLPLEGMTAEAVLDPPQSQSKAALFTEPSVRLTLVDRSNHQIEVRFSKPEKDSVWVRNGNSRSIFRVPKKAVEDWTSGLKDVAQ